MDRVLEASTCNHLLLYHLLLLLLYHHHLLLLYHHHVTCCRPTTIHHGTVWLLWTIPLPLRRHWPMNPFPFYGKQPMPRRRHDDDDKKTKIKIPGVVIRALTAFGTKLPDTITTTITAIAIAITIIIILTLAVVPRAGR